MPQKKQAWWQGAAGTLNTLQGRAALSYSGNLRPNHTKHQEEACTRDEGAAVDQLTLINLH